MLLLFSNSDSLLHESMMFSSTTLAWASADFTVPHDQQQDPDSLAGQEQC